MTEPGVFRLIHAVHSYTPSQRQCTVRIEIVCSRGSACQLLHTVSIIQQPRGWGAGTRAKDEHKAQGGVGATGGRENTV